MAKQRLPLKRMDGYELSVLSLLPPIANLPGVHHINDPEVPFDSGSQLRNYLTAVSKTSR